VPTKQLYSYTVYEDNSQTKEVNCVIHSQPNIINILSFLKYIKLGFH